MVKREELALLGVLALIALGGAGAGISEQEDWEKKSDEEKQKEMEGAEKAGGAVTSTVAPEAPTTTGTKEDVRTYIPLGEPYQPPLTRITGTLVFMDSEGKQHFVEHKLEGTAEQIMGIKNALIADYVAKNNWIFLYEY